MDEGAARDGRRGPQQPDEGATGGVRRGPVVAEVRVTPLRHALRTPYVWSQGVEDAFVTNLIEVVAEDGTTGIGETATAPDAIAQKRVIERLAAGLVGRSPWDHARVLAEGYRRHWLTFGANMPRHFAQVASGIEMAALDLCGKLAGRPVWDLLGGAIRDDVGYFHFLQGADAAALARDATGAVTAGHPILYLKVGMEAARDLEAVAAVRRVAPEARLRLDANEAWAPHVARRMLHRLAPFDPEYVEQPTPSASTEALGRATARSPVAIGADQAVFGLADLHRVAAGGLADLVAVGPREAGGLRATVKAAAVAEAAGMALCIHSSMTTGITTAAEHHAARAIPNLDDGNQIMWQLLARDVVAEPPLAPVRGRLSLPEAPGLGVTLDGEAVAAATRAFEAFS